MDTGSEFYFFLAFVLGAVFGFALRQMLEYRWQFTRYMPKRCPSCGGFHQKRHFKPAHHRAAGWTLICNRCWDFQFRPFSTEKTDEYTRRHGPTIAPDTTPDDDAARSEL